MGIEIRKTVDGRIVTMSGADRDANTEFALPLCNGEGDEGKHPGRSENGGHRPNGPYECGRSPFSFEKILP
jgi:hypothetical protein